MKKSLLTLSSLSIAAFVAAQQPIVVSVGGGLTQSSSRLKTDNYLGNGYNVKADVFMPFSRKGWDGSVKGSGKFVWGMIGAGSYFTGKSLIPDSAPIQSMYKLYNGSLTVINEQKGKSFNSGFIVSAGLQAGLALGRLSILPSFSAGFLSIRQDGFIQRSTAESKPVTLRESTKAKNTGFTFLPQVKFDYSLSPVISLYTSGSFIIGPTISTTQRRLIPAGGFNNQHTYEPDQLSSGTMRQATVQTSYRAFQLNLGVSWSPGANARRLKGKVTKPGDNGMLSRSANADSSKNPLYNPSGTETVNPLAMVLPGQPISGIVVKGGKNPGGNSIHAVTNENGEVTVTVKEAGEYTLQLTAPGTQDKSISEQGVKGNPPKNNKRKGRTYTGGRKNEAPDQNIMNAPGNPIGGIIVKGGKNPGPRDMSAVTNQDGEITFTATGPGEYIFQITAPESSGKSINEKGVKRSDQ